MKYQSKRPPRVKQQEALDASAGRIVFAYLMAMRTGKTKVTLDDFGRLYCDDELVDDLLIIAPAGVYKTWVGAINDEWPEWLINAANIHVWESGSYGTKKRQRELTAFLGDTGPRVFIVNVEALSMTQTARDAVLDFCADRRVYCAIDESTIIKNPQAECTKFCVLELAPVTTYRRILSGLITPKSPLDLFAQFAFLDRAILGFKKFTAFRARYAVMQQMQFGGRMVPVVVGHRDTAELAAKIKPHSFRVRLEDCYDLPSSTYAIRDVQMTKEQVKVYKEMVEFATASIEREGEQRHITATVVIAQITRLHQILCGHTTDEEGNFHEIPERRTEALLDLLAEYEEGKAIIWCSYDYNIRKVSAVLEKEYGKGSVARFWGGNRDTREQEELLFKTNPACRFMVATASAGGRGRTWDVADLVVYYSSTNNLEQRSQSEERPKGVGKTTSIQYTDLQVQGTVEEKFIYALRNKINLASIINGDTWREWLV